MGVAPIGARCQNDKNKSLPVRLSYPFVILIFYIELGGPLILVRSQVQLTLLRFSQFTFLWIIALFCSSCFFGRGGGEELEVQPEPTIGSHFRIRCGVQTTNSLDNKVRCDATRIDVNGNDTRITELPEGLVANWQVPQVQDPQNIVERTSCREIGPNSLSQECEITLSQATPIKFTFILHVTSLTGGLVHEAAETLTIPIRVQTIGFMPQIAMEFVPPQADPNAPQIRNANEVGFQNRLIPLKSDLTLRSSLDLGKITDICFLKGVTYLSTTRFLYRMNPDYTLQLFAGAAKSGLVDGLHRLHKSFSIDPKRPSLVCGENSIFVSTLESGRSKLLELSMDGSMRTLLISDRPRGRLSQYYIAPSFYYNNHVYYTYDKQIKKVDMNGRVTVIAGTSVQPTASIINFGNVNSSEAVFLDPRGMARGPDGSIYVADIGYHTIRKIDPSGQYVSTIAGIGNRHEHCNYQITGTGDAGSLATDVYLCEPYDIEVDSKGIIYLSDREFNRIRRIYPHEGTNVIGTFAGEDSVLWIHNEEAPSRHLLHNFKLTNPQGIALHGGYLYVTQDQNRPLVKIPINGGAIETFFRSAEHEFPEGKSADSHQIPNPDDLAMGPNNEIYVSQNIDPSREEINEFITALWSAIELGPKQDPPIHRLNTSPVYKIHSEGGIPNKMNSLVGPIVFSEILESVVPPDSQDEASAPNAADYGLLGIRAIDYGPDGSLYLVDGKYRKIRRIKNGKLMWVAGSGEVGFNNPVTTVQEVKFHHPISIAVGADSAVYVADEGEFSYRVQKINTLDGKVSIIAGNGNYNFTDGISDPLGTGMTPVGVTVANNGDVFISHHSTFDTNYPSLMLRIRNGVLTRVVGGGSTPLADNIEATQLRLGKLTSINVDRAGNLYAIEDLKHMIMFERRDGGYFSKVILNGESKKECGSGVILRSVSAAESQEGFFAAINEVCGSSITGLKVYGGCPDSTLTMIYSERLREPNAADNSQSAESHIVKATMACPSQ